MRKTKIVSSSHMLAKKKRHFQDYFDLGNNNIVTPNQRSLPKYRNHFHQPPHKSAKKDPNAQKRLSQGRPDRHKHKENFSPSHKPNRSNQKIMRFDQSINREYDSPSKDHEEIDFIVKGVQKKVKGNSHVESIIEKVNDNLKANKLNEAINVLKEALEAEYNNLDLQYLLGICYIFNGQYEFAIAILEEMMKSKPKKNIYLLLSVCYKKSERFQETQEILNKCIRNYPKYYEAYIYRGKMNLKIKEFKLAYEDFNRAIAIDSQKQIGYVGKGDCLRLMGSFENARAVYTEAITKKKNNVSLLLRRAICSMQLKKYETALDDINKLLESDFENSEALYFKGLIFNKIKQPNDAIICYQQAIKHNTNKRAVTRAIYEITKIKIQNRDYYEALFTLERAQYLDIDEKVIKKFKIFINGVTSMMKKNYQQGTKILTELLHDNEKPLSNFLKPLFYSTRSYGYMALEKFQNAKEDLQAMQNQFSLDLPNLYNKFICEGILACGNQKYQNALTLFSKAAKALPYRIEPAFYKALTLICFSTKLIPKEMKDKKKEYLQSAMRTIKKVETIENNPSLYMIRGLLEYSLGDLDAALKDFDQCLNESTKPNPLVFYLIGLIFAETGKYSEAIGQFKRAIDNDQKHQIPQAYLNRAKCMLLTDEINTGFIDLQSYMTYRPSSPDIHIWAGHLLFYIKAYEDANKAYSNINNVNKNFEVLLYKVKCYLIVKDVLNALANLKLMLQIKKDPKTLFDYEVIQCLRQCSEQNMSDYKAILTRMKQAKKNSNGQFGVLVEEYNYQFYKGVLYFYSQDYASAKKNFHRSLDLLNKKFQGSKELTQNDQEFLNQFNNLTYANHSFNYHQLYYNIIVCSIFTESYEEADKALQFFDNLPDGKEKTHIKRLSKALVMEIQGKDKGKKSKQQIQIEPFPVQNRLCSIFPEVLLPLSVPVRTRIFFCLPHVKKPDIVPRFQQKIFQEFTMSSIEIKPEAPWIRRSDQGVIFTDEVIKYDIELSQSSSSEEQKSEEEEEQEDYVANAEELFEVNKRGRRELSDEEFAHEDQEEEVQANKMTGHQLREFFKLDKETQERLAKFNKK